MARIRSPNYPGISLGEAMVKVAQVFGEEHKHPTPREVVAKHMGYSGVNGASLTAISALVKYGLLEQEGDMYRVTDLAVTLTHPQSPEEKAAAVNTAASKPALFAELLSQFKGKLPSDENLRAYLIRRGFNQSALTGCINSFRETMKLVSADGGGYGADRVPEAVERTMRPVAASASIQGGATVGAVAEVKPGQPFQVTLTVDRGVIVSGTLRDKADAALAIKMIEMAQAVLPTPKPDKQGQPGEV